MSKVSYAKCGMGPTIKVEVLNQIDDTTYLVRIADSETYYKLIGVAPSDSKIRVLRCSQMEPVEMCFHLHINDEVVSDTEEILPVDDTPMDERFEFSSYESALEWLQEAPRDTIYHIAIKSAPRVVR